MADLILVATQDEFAGHKLYKTGVWELYLEHDPSGDITSAWFGVREVSCGQNYGRGLRVFECEVTENFAPLFGVYEAPVGGSFVVGEKGCVAPLVSEGVGWIKELFANTNYYGLVDGMSIERI